VVNASSDTYIKGGADTDVCFAAFNHQYLKNKDGACNDEGSTKDCRIPFWSFPVVPSRATAFPGLETDVEAILYVYLDSLRASNGLSSDDGLVLYEVYGVGHPQLDSKSLTYESAVSFDASVTALEAGGSNAMISKTKINVTRETTGGELKGANLVYYSDWMAFDVSAWMNSRWDESGNDDEPVNLTFAILNTREGMQATSLFRSIESTPSRAARLELRQLPAPSRAPSSSPSSTPTLTLPPTPLPTSSPTTEKSLSGVVIATDKSVISGVVVYALAGVDNTDLASAVASTITNTNGEFSLEIPYGTTYTVLGEANGHMTNWASGILPGAQDALLVLPRAQLLNATDPDVSTATIVLQWGARSDSSLDEMYLGTPADLDLYLAFEVEDSGEKCVVSYAATSCGDATLVHNDRIEETAVDVGGLYGVETVQVSQFYSSAYTAWIGNYDLAMPVQTADATITVFVRDQRLAQVVLPSPCNYTSQDMVPLCPDYDDPINFDAAGAENGFYPFAYPEMNREKAQYARVLCMGMNSNSSTLVYESQRYFDATAFSYLSSSAAACPVAVDDCLADGKKDYYWCSTEIANAIIPCKGGLSDAVFCSSELGETCAYGPLATSKYSSKEAREAMCASGVR